MSGATQKGTINEIFNWDVMELVINVLDLPDKLKILKITFIIPQVKILRSITVWLKSSF